MPVEPVYAFLPDEIRGWRMQRAQFGLARDWALAPADIVFAHGCHSVAGYAEMLGRECGLVYRRGRRKGVTLQHGQSATLRAAGDGATFGIVAARLFRRL